MVKNERVSWVVVKMLQILQKKLFLITIGIGVLITILLVTISNKEPSSPLIPVEQLEAEETMKNDPNLEGSNVVLVDVKGEVNVPGVYELSPNARVNDVIFNAGGFTDKANQHMVNLAQKVFDEMLIIVPTIDDTETATTKLSKENTRVRINYATEEEIQQLTGIGPSKAKAIVAYREENGYFKSVEDLLEISGIGEKTLERIKDEIQIP